MNPGFTIVACIFAILVCFLALILNIIGGHFIVALIMVFCIAINAHNLVRLYNMTNEYKKY